MYSTIEEAWGEQKNANIETFINDDNKRNTNTITNTNTNTNTNANTNTNTNANTNTNTNANANANTNANIETFINDDDNKTNEIIYIKEKSPKNLQNKNIIQAFLMGILIILILQLINNKFIKNI
jgi:hypothetical protein